SKASSPTSPTPAPPPSPAEAPPRAVGAPTGSSSLEDDSPATQVMMNPLADSPVAPKTMLSAPVAVAPPSPVLGEELDPPTNPGSTVRADSSFFSNMAEDEIGAAFDSVLGGGAPGSNADD